MSSHGTMQRLFRQIPQAGGCLRVLVQTVAKASSSSTIQSSYFVKHVPRIATFSTAITLSSRGSPPEYPGTKNPKVKDDGKNPNWDDSHLTNEEKRLRAEHDLKNLERTTKQMYEMDMYRVVAAIQDVGVIYLDQEKFVGSEVYLSRAAVIAETQLQDDKEEKHAELLASCLSNLGLVYFRIKKWDLAQQTLERLASRMKHHTFNGAGHMRHQTLIRLSKMYIDSEEFFKADRVLLEALSVTNQSMDVSSTDMSLSQTETMFMIGLVKHRQTRFEDALDRYNDAIRILSSNHLTHSSDSIVAGRATALLADLHRYCGTCLLALERRDEAILELQKALDLRKLQWNSVNGVHPEVIHALHDLSVVYDIMERPRDVLGCLKEQLTIAERLQQEVQGSQGEHREDTLFIKELKRKITQVETELAD
eukprot:Clim_evm6s180 gene=Clim_evmTU6s180